MNSQKPIMLLVEDSDDDAALILRAVGKSHPDVSVERASTMSEGIRRLDELSSQGAKPFLCLVDGRVSGADASEILEHLRKSLVVDVSAVVLSGAVVEGAVDRYLELGAAEVLNKPVEYSAFIGLIAQIVDKYKVKSSAA